MYQSRDGDSENIGYPFKFLAYLQVVLRCLDGNFFVLQGEVWERFEQS